MSDLIILNNSIVWDWVNKSEIFGMGRGGGELMARTNSKLILYDISILFVPWDFSR